MTEDAQCLARFARNGDENAFRELVALHVSFVYATALRRLNGDAALAQDITQIVFTTLARKARFLSCRVVLAGWLHEATRLEVAKLVRGEQRRRVREQEAAAMHHCSDFAPDWNSIHPVLDAALDQLKTADRNAVLLHYFEKQGFQAIGEALGISQQAAQKRVSRSLARLRELLARRGLTTTAATLALMLSANAVHAAPTDLLASVSGAALAGAPTAMTASLGASFAAWLGLYKAHLTILILFLTGAGTVGFLAAHQNAHGPYLTVDLSSYYNGSLQQSWTPAYRDNHLAALGAGRLLLRHVPFDVGGVVQLQGQIWKQRGYNFPERVEGIPVGRICERIILLHANSAFTEQPGTIVAFLVIHYADGEQAQIPIRHGEHVLDWWDWRKTPPTDRNTVLAWRGDNPAAKVQGVKVRLYKTVFANPQPAKEISTIDYVSAMANSAPFMVAMTIEGKASL